MKPAYTIIITGTGPHHQGHTTGNLERDADHQLKALVQKLQSAGHTVHHASFQIQDGTPEIIVGGADNEKPAWAGSDDRATSLDTILTELRDHRTEFQKFVAYEKREDQDDPKAPKPAKPRAKKEAAAPDAPKPPVETPASPPAPQEPQEEAKPAVPAPTTGDSTAEGSNASE